MMNAVNVKLALGMLFFPLVLQIHSSYETDCHDVIEILFKVVLFNSTTILNINKSTLGGGNIINHI